MKHRHLSITRLVLLSIFASLLPFTVAAQVRPEMFQELRWRSIGPYRGGRTRSAAGVPQQPNVFYIGVCNGGVWKTTDFGRAWQPIFDDQPTGSIGALAVAPSDANVIYVGSGEGLHRPDLSVGDGIYKSTDAGKTWTHLGLRDGQQMRTIAIDPKDPNRLFVAVVGHPYGPNDERGIYRSTDGGQSFKRVLYKDENTGASDVVLDPANPSTVYAALWEAREGPWENGAFNGTNGGIFKSTDGGETWQPLTGGLPSGVVQANLAIAPSDPKRLIAAVATKDKVALYRTDDAGATWTQITTDERPAGRIGGGDLPVLGIDPKNPDVVYSTSTVTWKSADGGKTWTGFRGAPGGDDYQNLWISPNDSNTVLLVSDQGAIITVNGGQTWSSWYNQPTAQMYHANADNAFPYRVCSGQQESGSACVLSRGNDGAVTFRDWHPVAAEEYGYVTPDPLDPDIIYGGKLSRYDRRTGQAQNILPKPLRPTDFRMLRTEPVQFSPLDPRTLYFAANTLWKTSDGGKSWTQISPDLTRKTFVLPASVGKFQADPAAKVTQRGVIYSLGLSPLDVKRIWAGTDDGLIQLTTDGGSHWTDVTPKELVPFAKVSIIEPSHTDAQTAYAAINTLRLDDLRPHILRTRDGGKSWAEIVNGIPANENVNAVREDPKRKGMLFASTERAVYVSFDDGEHWQSLRLNMAPSSVRDVIIKDDDLIAATHGRGFWILDNITALRQLDAKVSGAEAFLFQPQVTYLVRWNMNTDTPLPPDEPTGANPPDGAMIDYYLKSAGTGPVTLEIRDSTGTVISSFSSADKPAPTDPMLPIPTYWVRPPQVLSSAPGMHRFLWNMHYPDIPGQHNEFPIAAVAHNTVPDPSGPWVVPGQYTVALTANGKTLTQPLTIKIDPRVKTPQAGLAQQFRLSKQLYDAALTLAPAFAQAEGYRTQLGQLHPPAGPVADAVAAFTKRLDVVAGGGGSRRGRRGQTVDIDSVASVRTALLALMGMLQEVDDTPTTQTTMAVSERLKAVPAVLQNWETFEAQQVPAFNAQLKTANLPELKASPAK